MLEEKGLQPYQFQDRIISMSMYNDIVHWNHDNNNECWDTARRVAQYAQKLQTKTSVISWSWRWRLDEHTLWRIELNREQNDARIRWERALCSQVLISIAERRAQT